MLQVKLWTVNSQSCKRVSNKIDCEFWIVPCVTKCREYKNIPSF